MSQLKSQSEMTRIRAADSILREKQIREFIPEKNESKPIAYFEIARYTTGNFKGLFLVYQILIKDAYGKTLKEPVRKLVCEGVDMVVAMANLETALRKRVFR